MAVLFDQEPGVGGGYFQALNACLLSEKLPASICTVFFYSTTRSGVDSLAALGLPSQHLRLGWGSGYEMALWGSVGSTRRGALWLRKVWKDGPLQKALRPNGIDLVYFTSPSPLVKGLGALNYFVTVWDLAHRDQPEFPEVRDHGIFDGRERLYREVSLKASGIFVDSVIGRRQLVERYGATPERVHVLPFSPAPSVVQYRAGSEGIPITAKLGISFKYILYPASFWPHKNHIFILRALRILAERHGRRVGAVFCGGDQGNRLYIESAVADLDLKDRVRIVGFVEAADLVSLYQSSLALVMPTYFGPTNIPPCEAFHLGVPVVYSDLPGLRDQVGEAALLVDLDDPGTLAEAIRRLLVEPSLRHRLVEEGRRQLGTVTEADRIGTLVTALRRFRSRRICWA